jgi:hypothetical protein
MWNWFNCYLSGRHDYGVWCEPGTIFLRCVHCGRRSAGWALNRRAQGAVVPPPAVTAPPSPGKRILPFDRPAAVR